MSDPLLSEFMRERGSSLFSSIFHQDTTVTDAVAVIDTPATPKTHDITLNYDRLTEERITYDSSVGWLKTYQDAGLLDAEGNAGRVTVKDGKIYINLPNANRYQVTIISGRPGSRNPYKVQHVKEYVEGPTVFEFDPVNVHPTSEDGIISIFVMEYAGGWRAKGILTSPLTMRAAELKVTRLLPYTTNIVGERRYYKDNVENVFKGVEWDGVQWKTMGTQTIANEVNFLKLGYLKWPSDVPEPDFEAEARLIAEKEAAQQAASTASVPIMPSGYTPASGEKRFYWDEGIQKYKAEHWDGSVWVFDKYSDSEMTLNVFEGYKKWSTDGPTDTRLETDGYSIIKDDREFAEPGSAVTLTTNINYKFNPTDVVVSQVGDPGTGIDVNFIRNIPYRLRIYRKPYSSYSGDGTIVFDTIYKGPQKVNFGPLKAGHTVSDGTFLNYLYYMTIARPIGNEWKNFAFTSGFNTITNKEFFTVKSASQLDVEEKERLYNEKVGKIDVSVSANSDTITYKIYPSKTLGGIVDVYARSVRIFHTSIGNETPLPIPGTIDTAGKYGDWKLVVKAPGYVNPSGADLPVNFTVNVPEPEEVRIARLEREAAEARQAAAEARQAELMKMAQSGVDISTEPDVTAETLAKVSAKMKQSALTVMGRVNPTSTHKVYSPSRNEIVLSSVEFPKLSSKDFTLYDELVAEKKQLEATPIPTQAEVDAKKKIWDDLMLAKEAWLKNLPVEETRWTLERNILAKQTIVERWEGQKKRFKSLVDSGDIILYTFNDFRPSLETEFDVYNTKERPTMEVFDEEIKIQNYNRNTKEIANGYTIIPNVEWYQRIYDEKKTAFDVINDEFAVLRGEKDAVEGTVTNLNIQYMTAESIISEIDKQLPPLENRLKKVDEKQNAAFVGIENLKEMMGDEWKKLEGRRTDVEHAEENVEYAEQQEERREEQRERMDEAKKETQENIQNTLKYRGGVDGVQPSPPIILNYMSNGQITMEAIDGVAMGQIMLEHQKIYVPFMNGLNNMFAFEKPNMYDDPMLRPMFDSKILIANRLNTATQGVQLVNSNMVDWPEFTEEEWAPLYEAKKEELIQHIQNIPAEEMGMGEYTRDAAGILPTTTTSPGLTALSKPGPFNIPVWGWLSIAGVSLTGVIGGIIYASGALKKK